MLNFLAGGAQGNTRRPTAGGDARQQAPTGLGGLGVPDLEGMMGGMPDPAMLTQLMQNPAISQMMQSILSNPQTMNQVLVTVPMTCTYFELIALTSSFLLDSWSQY